LLFNIDGFESFIGTILVTFSSIAGDDLLDNVSCCFFVLLLLTVVLLEISFLITDCCCSFFFGLFIDGSTLTFLVVPIFAVGTGENGLFCGGERRITGSGGGGGGNGICCSSSASLSGPSSLFVDIGVVSFIFYI
jgi:hypothetical protein